MDGVDLAATLVAPRGVPVWATQLVFDLHERIRSAVRSELAASNEDRLSAIAHYGAGDVSFRIDVRPEELVAEVMSGAPEPILVVAEVWEPRCSRRAPIPQRPAFA